MKDFEMERCRALIKDADLWDQLAEECCELSQAAHKMSRYLRGVNPPRKSRIAIEANITEEISDVQLCLDLLRVRADPEVMDFKLERMINHLGRLREANHE